MEALLVKSKNNTKATPSMEELAKMVKVKTKLKTFIVDHYQKEFKDQFDENTTWEDV